MSLLSLLAVLALGPELVPVRWGGSHRLRSLSPYVDELGRAVRHFLANGMAISMADLYSINIATVLFPSKSDFSLTLSGAVPCSVPCFCLCCYCNLACLRACWFSTFIFFLALKVIKSITC